MEQNNPQIRIDLRPATYMHVNTISEKTFGMGIASLAEIKPQQAYEMLSFNHNFALTDEMLDTGYPLRTPYVVTEGDVAVNVLMRRGPLGLLLRQKNPVKELFSFTLPPKYQ